MTSSDIFTVLVGNALLFGALQVAAAVWLKARLEASIRHEYDRRLENYRRELDRKQRAAIVAELFAEWASPTPDRKVLNRLSWEVSLWLPSSIVKDVTKRLANASDAREVKDILVDVRKHLAPGDDIAAHDIVHFPQAT